jgi:hypothetical protein
MGRPINKRLIGNVSASGQQLSGYAWTAGDSQARPSYVVKQKTTNSYIMASIDGTGVAGGGQVYLVNGAITAAGQGNITVTPFGGLGSGVTATANIGISGSPTINVSGTGATTADFLPGELLQLQGGTYTGNQQANVTVNSVALRVATPVYTGAAAGYAVGDYFLFNGTGFTSAANVQVASVDVRGNISTVNIVGPGVYTNTVLRTDPVTANVVVTSGGSGVTWNLGWGLGQVSVTNAGDYTTIPANPVSLAGSAAGTGGKINVTYSISSVKVTAAGSGYETPPNVTFSTGNASAHSVIVGGAVTSVVVDSGGSGYAAKPTLSFADTATVDYARKITDRLVYTWDGKQYEWLMTGATLPGIGWAHVQSQ